MIATKEIEAQGSEGVFPKDTSLEECRARLQQGRATLVNSSRLPGYHLNGFAKSHKVNENHYSSVHSHGIDVCATPSAWARGYFKNKYNILLSELVGGGRP